MSKNHDMMMVQSANNKDGLRDVYNNDIWTEFKEEINQQMDEIKRKLDAILAAMKDGGTTAVWAMVQILVAKISMISTELAQGPISAQNDFDSVAKALAALEEDIKNMEAKGVKDPSNPGVSQEDAAKFAKDLKTYEAASQKWEKDYHAAPKEYQDKYFNADQMMNKNMDVLLSIVGQKTDITDKSIGELVAFGDMVTLAKVLNVFAYYHGKNVKNGTTYDDVFDNWETGNAWFCKSDGIDVFLHTELPAAIAENNDLINEDGNKVNNSVSVASACVKAGTDQGQYFVSHQIANG